MARRGSGNYLLRLSIILMIFGFGSALLSFTDYQFTALSWANGVQPWLGIILGVAGIAILVVPLIARRSGGTIAPAQHLQQQQGYGYPPQQQPYGAPQQQFGQQQGFNPQQGFGQPQGFPQQTPPQQQYAPQPGFSQPQLNQPQLNQPQPGFAPQQGNAPQPGFGPQGYNQPGFGQQQGYGPQR